MRRTKADSLRYVKIDKSLRFIIDSFAIPDQCRVNLPLGGLLC
jgi:hypothetical protein